MKRTILLFFIAASFYSCSKKSDGPEVQIPIEGTYISANSLEFKPIRMFTVNGEVQDVQVIANFVSQKKLQDYFRVQPGKVAQEIEFSVVVNADKSVEAKNGSEIIQASLTNYEGNIARVTGQVSENWIMSSGGTCLDKFNKLNLMRFDHLVDCRTISQSTGFSRMCKSQKGFFIIVETEKRIYLPLQSYRLSNYTKFNDDYSECSYAASNEWNLVNPDHNKNLGSNDTLIVQEKRLMLNKK
ncbi:hypothetical protein LPB86_15905 [Pedobacter sp. MC2016-14]|uniref:hypothetical protein n=1 Tax=Pedobacter sp. MC2016-14 TaxID=2897327 RepID=UPI001E3C9E56|nr:hypothetical protein [Pedobacter sp. MC2016-14]MCD0489727.1 hypothetical protein [Pedobacter sp. MC2016-14]